MYSSHAPTRGFATVNTLERDRHQYVTELDVVLDRVALENGELTHGEVVRLVEHLTTLAYTGGRQDATA